MHWVDFRRAGRAFALDPNSLMYSTPVGASAPVEPDPGRQRPWLVICVRLVRLGGRWDASRGKRMGPATAERLFPFAVISSSARRARIPLGRVFGRWCV